MTELIFHPLTFQHLPLLHTWLQLPHVREFWDDGDRTVQQVQAHYFASQRDVLAFVAALDTEMVAYLQTYPVMPDSEYAFWCSEKGETWGIDLFIGERKWLGRGLAVPLITAFVRHLQELQPDLKRILIDPEHRNERARHVYNKAGFVSMDVVEIGFKRLNLMALDLSG